MALFYLYLSIHEVLCMVCGILPLFSSVDQGHVQAFLVLWVQWISVGLGNVAYDSVFCVLGLEQPAVRPDECLVALGLFGNLIDL